MVQYLDDDEEPGFFAKYRIPIILFVLAAVGGGLWFVANPPEEQKPRRTANISIVMPPLPPPPPPPPPKQEPTPPPEPEEREEQDEMIEEEMIAEETPSDEPEDASEPALGTDLVGEGGPDYGLAKGGGTGLIGGLGGGGGRRGSRFGGYASQVQNRVAEVLKSNSKTKSAVLSVTVRIWADSTGRVTRATMTGSSGKPDVDNAIREALTGLQLMEPPPPDMPMPIVMKIRASRS